MALELTATELAAFQNGDKRIFNKIVTAYQKKIFISLDEILDNPRVALEISNIVFMKLWNARAKMKENKQIINFLYLVARHRRINWQKSKERENEANTIPFPDFDQISFHEQQEIFSQERRAAEIEEMMEYIIQAAEDLPDQCKTIFRLSKLEEKRTKDIAHQLNISEQNVSVQIRKAIDKIREALAKKGFKILIIIYLFKNLF
jgi:RNA polymerase sigma-70 factor (ECF subfamily)